MSTVTFSHALMPLAGTDATPAKDTSIERPGFFARLLTAMIASRQARADREIARLEIAYGIKLRMDETSVGAITRAELPFQR